MKKKILVVAFYFPPFNRVGVRRITHLVDFLRKQDVDVTVLKADNKYYGNAREKETFHHSFRVLGVETNHVKLPLPVTLNVFYDYFFWNRAFKKAVARVVREEPVHAIYFTGGPFFYFTVGAYIKKKYGIPYILDFRDPWLAGHHQKLRLTRPILFSMESKAIQSAELVFDVTPAMSAFRRRFYNRLNPDRFEVFENGFDDNLVKDLKVNARPISSARDLNLGIWGKFSYYSERDTDILFQAMHKLKQEAALPLARLKFLCDPQIEAYSLQKVKDLSLQDEVEFIDYGGYREGLQLLGSLDCLVLNHRSPLMVGTKIYDYIYLNKPIVAFARPKSAIADLLSGLKNAFLVSNTSEFIQALLQIRETGVRELNPQLDVYRYSRNHALEKAFPAIKKVLQVAKIK